MSTDTDLAVDTADPVATDDSDSEADLGVPERFTVCNPETANWVVKKVIEARSYAHRVRMWAARETARAEATERQLLYLFGRQLEDWVRREIATNGGRRKSIPLPAGTVGFRTVPPSLTIDNDDLV